MAVSTIITMHRAQKNSELIKKLQQKARMFFYDSIMYEINDSLTSILAICDKESRVEDIAKIKQYINRINESLGNNKKYQNDLNEKKFDINFIIKNLIYVLKENNKEAKIIYSPIEIKATAQGDQSKFEELFLCVLVDMLQDKNTVDNEIAVGLKQKNQDALVTIVNNKHVFSKEAIDQIYKIKEEINPKGNTQIISTGEGVEVIIRIPLEFQSFKLIRRLKMPNIWHKI